MESSSSDEENILPTFSKEPDFEVKTDSNLVEDNLAKNVLCSEELLVNGLSDKAAGEHNSISNNQSATGEMSCNNMKFLSSEFFDQFICQPSTSKDNPDIIRKFVERERDIENESETVQPLTTDASPELQTKSDFKLETENLSSGCKLRKNVDKHEEKNSDNNKSAHTGNVPFQSFGNYVPPFTFIQPEKKSYSSSDEYFSDLRLWLQQAFFWQSVTAAFPYFLMCQQFSEASNTPNQQAPPGFNFPPQFSFPFPQFQNMGQQTNEPSSSSPQSPQNTPRQQIIDGVECRIPSFWKRITAEFIDFMILFFVKIAVTYVAIDFFHLVDLDQLDLLNKDTKLAYKQFMQITQEIVILELIHRLVVCAFETFWLRSGHNGQIGGATPGKSIMGLRVIYCESSVFLREAEGVVIVRPGTNLGLTTAFFRSLTKNFVLALLVPTSFAFIFFPHNRTGYDMICSTIVVEDPVIPNRIND